MFSSRVPVVSLPIHHLLGILSSLLCEVENKGVFKGLTINQSVPSVSHLLFADVLMIYREATIGNLEITK